MLLDMMSEHLDKPTKALRLVAPNLREIPEDSLLQYNSIEEVKDLLAPQDHGVVLTFSDDTTALLDMWVNYIDQFDGEPVVVTGVPGADYSPEFEKVAYKLQRVAYHTLISDLVEEARRETSMTEEEKETSIYAREKAQFTRKSGKVKEFAAFDAPNLTLEAGEPGSVDEAEVEGVS